jgi:hypothetical protein
VLASAELRNALGSAAHEVAKRYSADAGALAMLDLYEKIATQKREHLT